jgi:hypothetical protein
VVLNLRNGRDISLRQALNHEGGGCPLEIVMYDTLSHSTFGPYVSDESGKPQVSRNSLG